MGPTSWGNYLRQALKSPIVIFALAFGVIVAIGAPLFALGDLIK